MPASGSKTLANSELVAKAIAYSHNTRNRKPALTKAFPRDSMRVLIALLLAQASAFLCQHRRTLHTSLRSDPRDEAIEVEAYVEDLIENITGEKAKQDEEINQKSVDAMIDSAIGSDDDPFKDIPKATGLLDNL